MGGRCEGEQGHEEEQRTLWISSLRHFRVFIGKWKLMAWADTISRVRAESNLRNACIVATDESMKGERKLIQF